MRKHVIRRCPTSRIGGYVLGVDATKERFTTAMRTQLLDACSTSERRRIERSILAKVRAARSGRLQKPTRRSSILSRVYAGAAEVPVNETAPEPGRQQTHARAHLHARGTLQGFDRMPVHARMSTH